MGNLIDRHGRQMTKLRISVTDRCDLRCVYCMPEEGLPWLPEERLLTSPEIARLSRIFVRVGIVEIRLTGGEPTLRPDLPELVRVLSLLRATGLRSLGLTTNGLRLQRLAGELAVAGLTRINVSLDSLVREKYRRITRRDRLDVVLAGLEELERHPGINPIKVNVVSIRGFTEGEVLDFARLARSKPYVVRFIEYMPLDADGNWRRELVLAGKEIFEAIDAGESLLPIANSDPSSTAKRYRFADGRGELGFVNSVTEPFCWHCNRIRLTADGQLRTCLFSVDETDLRTPMREGASDEELAVIVAAAVKQKVPRHAMNDRAASPRSRRSMSQIGG